MTTRMSVSDEDAIALLTDLVSVQSTSGEEREASECLVDWMSEHGFAAKVDEAGNAVGVRGSGVREILLLGHIDTFPGVVPVRRDGDVLYGRGSVDAKGPLCAFAAAATLVEIPDGWRVTVVGGVEEESATSRGARHVLQQRLEASSPPAFCVIGEPSGWDRITIGYKGRVLADIEMRVPFSHSAGQERLPAERGVELWGAIEELCDSENERMGAARAFDKLLPSLRKIVTRDDGAFGTVNMSVGIRLPPSHTPELVEQQVRGMLSESYSGLISQCGFAGHEPAFLGGKSNALVRSFLSAIRGNGGKPRFVVKTGTCDMNVVGPHWPDTPILAYGPGDSALDHTPDEHVDLGEFLKAVRVLEQMMDGVVG